MRRGARALIGLCTALLTAGCGALVSFTEYSSESSEGDGGEPSSHLDQTAPSSDGGGGSEGGMTAVITDAGVAMTPDSSTMTLTDGRVCETKETLCGDGLDNDCNGVADCADPACVSYGSQCVMPPSDPGWTGPLALITGDVDGGGLIPCGAAYPNGEIPMAFAGLTVPPSCACTCQPDHCEAPMPGFFGQSCDPSSPAPAGNTLRGDGKCTDYTLFIVAQNSVQLGTFSAVAKSVVADAGPVSFAQSARACMVTGMATGCTGAEVCAPVAPNGFQSVVCYAHAGDGVTCPAGFTAQHVVYQGAKDNRTCSCGCTCNGGCVGGTVEGFDIDCDISPAHTVQPGACNKDYAKLRAMVSPGTTECSPHVTAGGTVDKTGPQTICCN